MLPLFPVQSGKQRSGGESSVGGLPEATTCVRAGTIPFLAQSELLLCFFSQVISGCAEVIVVLNQHILHFKVIHEQCFQTTP